LEVEPMTAPTPKPLTDARARLIGPVIPKESAMALLGAAGLAATAALALSAAVILGPPAAIAPHHPTAPPSLRLD
jgi:hypothetical protein